MKTLQAHIYLSALFGAALTVSSCVSAPGSYGSYSNPLEGYSMNIGMGWTSSSFDPNGFPIFGYTFGRPVYGYTAEGLAVFNPATLNSTCYVPDWSPAPWHQGRNYHPSSIYRVAAPPYYPKGHHPNQRPPMGTQAPPRPVRYTPPGQHTQSSSSQSSEQQEPEDTQQELPPGNTEPATTGSGQTKTGAYQDNIFGHKPTDENSRSPHNKEHGFAPAAGFSRGGSSRPHSN